MGDLRNVLNGLNSINASEDDTSTVNNVNDEIQMKEPFTYGEHIAYMWTDNVGLEMNWHIGVVDSVGNNELSISS